MKKLFLITVLITLSFPIFSQQNETILTNKDGIAILPERGNIAIGIDAVPFLNLLNDKGDSPGFNFINNIPALSLKYFNTNSSALRASVMIGYNSLKAGDESLENYNQEINSSFGVNLGYEKRLGVSRVQGFYGLQGEFIYGKDKITNDEEIVFMETSTLGLGASLFVGAEVFVATKLSIGGQFSWGPTYIIEKDTENNTAFSTFNLSTSNANGALILLFHF